MVREADNTVMDYFSVLLKQPPKQLATMQQEVSSLVNAEVETLEKSVDKPALEKLLERVAKPEEVDVSPIDKVRTSKGEYVASVTDKPEAVTSIEAEQREEITSELATPKPTVGLVEALDEEFQVLFFNVAGLILAVPLVSLGGIVQIEKVTKVFGRPEWFKGVQTNREQQINIVDTAAWVMPEKYTDELKATTEYQYIVLLAGSNWGLACESLVNADKIDKYQVNWRKNIGKRPWLAGVVKKQMCGILDVQSLINMLDNGIDSRD
ncbi:MAG: chemotaxis protein CheW [Parashewanella sp.]